MFSIHNVDAYNQENVAQGFDTAAQLWSADRLATARLRTLRGEAVSGAHEAYTVVCPTDVVRRLETVGFTRSRIHFKKNGLGALLDLQFPSVGGVNLEDGRYEDHVKILLNHEGRASIKIAIGAVRVACDNQFLLPAFSIHHNSEEAADFLEHPETWAFNARSLGCKARSILETIRAAKVPGRPLLDTLAADFPRLADKAWRRSREYRRQDPGPSWDSLTAWALLQGMTAAHSPKLQDLANRALLDTPAILGGLVPAGWYGPGRCTPPAPAAQTGPEVSPTLQ